MVSLAIAKALQIYGIAIVISMLVAVLIKVLVAVTSNVKKPAAAVAPATGKRQTAPGTGWCSCRSRRRHLGALAAASDHIAFCIR